MIYLLLGEDQGQKESKIQQLKDKILTSANARHFDYEVLYANKLNSHILQKALKALPGSGLQRLVVIRDCQHLSDDNQEFILQFAALKPEHLTLVLEAARLGSQDSFVKGLKSFVKIVESSTVEKENVFDMTRAMTMHRPAEALKILSTLLAEGVHPLQIMGGLVWFWGKSRPQLMAEKFEKGLLLLQEADLNIKRSRLPPDYAMEVIVVKLCNLLA